MSISHTATLVLGGVQTKVNIRMRIVHKSLHLVNFMNEFDRNNAAVITLINFGSFSLLGNSTMILKYTGIVFLFVATLVDCILHCITAQYRLHNMRRGKSTGFVQNTVSLQC